VITGRPGDRRSDLAEPITLWRVRAPVGARVHEVHGIADWLELCDRYPDATTCRTGGARPVGYPFAEPERIGVWDGRLPD
jgi:hypothetical protein